MDDGAIVVLAYFGMGITLVLIFAFWQPIAIALISLGAARALNAEARLLGAKNRAAALASQEPSDGR